MTAPTTDIPRDELHLGELLEDFVPFTGGPEAEKVLSRWTKYEKADDDVWNVKLAEGEELVLVRRPDTGTLGIVHRSLENLVELEEGKTFRNYSIVSTCPVDSIEEGAELMRRIRSAREVVVAREIDGFGNVVVDGRSVLTDAATGKPAEDAEVTGF